MLQEKIEGGSVGLIRTSFLRKVLILWKQSWQEKEPGINDEESMAEIITGGT